MNEVVVSSGDNINASGGDNQDNQLQGGNYPKDFVEKLKREKANARAEADQLKQQLASKESQDLEKAGKLNELVELERARNKELEEKSKNLSNAIIQKAVLTSARDVAQKEGAQYFEAIEKLIDPTKIEVNPETLEVDTTGIKSQIIAIKARMPGLFVTAPPRTNDLPPGMGGKMPEKSLADYSKDELKALLKQKL
jgi:hypothetical protein